MLVAVIFLLALLTIALAVALPKVSKEIQRDRELETMHRGKQYIRAVKHVLQEIRRPIRPTSMRWSSPPTTSASCARNISTRPPARKIGSRFALGQNKAPTAMGFFGQPLGGIGGCAPSADRRKLCRQLFVQCFLQHHVQHSGAHFRLHDRRQRGTAPVSALTPSTGTPNSPTDPNAANTTDSTTSSTTGQPAKRGRPSAADRHHRLLSQQPQAVHHGLQDEEPLQRVGVCLRPDCRADDGERRQGGRAAPDWQACTAAHGTGTDSGCRATPASDTTARRYPTHRHSSSQRNRSAIASSEASHNATRPAPRKGRALLHERAKLKARAGMPRCR